MPKAADLFDGELISEVEEACWPFRSQIADAEQVRCALALARQKRIAAANARLQRGFIDGVGEVVASIDADLYHRLGLLYGYETVGSADFLRTLLRDNPECRVRTGSRRVGVFLAAHYREAGRVEGLGLRVDGAEADEDSAGVCTGAGEIAEEELAGEAAGALVHQPSTYDHQPAEAA